METDLASTWRHPVQKGKGGHRWANYSGETASHSRLKKKDAFRVSGTLSARFQGGEKPSCLFGEGIKELHL